MSAVVAALLSLVIPGLGQAYSGEKRRGAAIFLGLLVLLAVLVFSVVGVALIFIVEPVIHIAAAYDAYKIASDA